MYIYFFSVKELKTQSSIEKLCEAIRKDKYGLTLKTQTDSIEKLNEILTIPGFYESWRKVQPKDQVEIFSNRHQKLIETVKECKNSEFDSLEEHRKLAVVELNRLLLESTYPKECPSYFWKIVWEWVESIVIALLLAIVIRSYFIQPFKIPSGSMRMTLVEGDHLFVNKLRYGPTVLPPIHIEIPPTRWTAFLSGGEPIRINWPPFLDQMTKIRLPGFGHPKRGDVVVFVYPEDRTKDFIKRLIGEPGDQIEIKDGSIYVNGQQVTDAPMRNLYYYNRGNFGQEGVPITVPAGHYFMLGDNSGSSHDSRFWGFIQESDIIGKADVLFWPLNRIRLIK